MKYRRTFGTFSRRTVGWVEILTLPDAVKPLALMRYLCRLVTPLSGIVLDCFAGSGSTLISARDEGFRFVGIERDEHYIEIAKARLAGTAADQRSETENHQTEARSSQLSLFPAP